MQLYAPPELVNHHVNFPVVKSHFSGGMRTKMTAVSHALNCEIVTDPKKAQGDLLIEPLSIKAPRQSESDLETKKEWREREWERVKALQEYPYQKFLLCSEMEVLRWSGNLRTNLLKHIKKVFSVCRYQQDMLKSLGIPSEIVYEPINEYLFYPSEKRKKQVIAMGAPKHIKNTEMIIEVFSKLKGYHRVYIGSPVMWNFDWNDPVRKSHDLNLYRELLKVCDETYEASASTFVARKLSESEFYINFAYHEVCCRSAMESFLAGTKVVGGEHPLWSEYPVSAQVKTAEDAVKAIKEHTGNLDTVPAELRQWALDRFSFRAYKQRIQEAIRAN